MYTEFFGLKEKPFALVPDPRYLYLGSSHREALAHLLYGVEAGEGFIEVVGQVGTGKTTLCRTLVDRIGPDVEIGFIFNPSPSEFELLAAINREFGLPTASRTRTELIEDLNRFLVEKKAAGRRILLVIDEAQNLDADVLEQIRLLSNLETEREKLLQIVLLGQPELEEHLSRSELRQLRQRITVRWRLDPFTRDETAAYLEHRLRVAGARDPRLFSRGAIAAIYRASRGIPRVINSLADRALLDAYSREIPRVGARSVWRAARELPASELRPWYASFGLGLPAAALLVVLGLGVGIGLARFGPTARMAEPLPSVDAARLDVQSGAPAMEPPVPVAPAGPDPMSFPEGSLERALLSHDAGVTASSALDALLEAWGYAPLGAGDLNPNLYASAVREISPLRVFATRASREQVTHINLPVILELEPAPEQLRYAALLELLPDGSARLAAGGTQISLDAEAFERLWTGRTFFIWTNFESVPVLAPGMNGTAVRWLQARLTDLGYLRQGTASGEFDPQTQAAIQSFQTEHGISATGEVGPDTLIALYQQLRYGAPRLTPGEGMS
jgi:general secretion pathway protein A